MARGGIAGALTGILVAGLGGRVAMRLAAIMEPASAGRFTENGARIGEITLSGSVGLILLGGLFFGLSGGVVWVVVSPWIPGAGIKRAIVAMPVALALTGIALIRGDNPDFRILGYDGRVVGVLLALVALAGLSIALIDAWLERHLPRAGSSARIEMVYTALALAGGLLFLPIVVQTYLAADARLGLALVAVGLLTLARWAVRLEGGESPPWLLVAGRTCLAVAVAFGAAGLASEAAAALGPR